MYKVVAQDLFAGSCGGASGILAGYPFDTVKTLIQNQTLPVKYKSTFQTIGLVAKEVRNLLYTFVLVTSMEFVLGLNIHVLLSVGL